MYRHSYKVVYPLRGFAEESSVTLLLSRFLPLCRLWQYFWLDLVCFTVLDPNGGRMSLFVFVKLFLQFLIFLLEVLNLLVLPVNDLPQVFVCPLESLNYLLVPWGFCN